jgi:hypothetical protein
MQVAHPTSNRRRRAWPFACACACTWTWTWIALLNRALGAL